MIALIPHIVRRRRVTAENLRGIAVGNQPVVKLNYGAEPERVLPPLPGRNRRPRQLCRGSVRLRLPPAGRRSPAPPESPAAAPLGAHRRQRCRRTARRRPRSADDVPPRRLRAADARHASGRSQGGVRLLAGRTDQVSGTVSDRS